MPTLIDVLPKFQNENDQECFMMSPGAKDGDTYLDGYVRVEWFKTVFPDIATGVLPLSQTRYEALKAIGDMWKINAINWRKSGLVAVYNTPADKLIDEEEAFLLEMYPPPAEEQQPTTEENTTEGA
ncbi:hypothetical protein CPT_Pookie9 [Bacillus phage Pookie]|uniref:Uncharacterized protein n=1 Tax=Bacillus phage Pookie TaxID=1540093 RepID=A0A0A0RPY2_9CAUD|nr:hypothetical protein CPT_Pookie9 [Bacillus phage Pookie]AIW03694.1 hypothetical protein CPT_Pookie9 [Bacillus phage Pookie]